MGLTLAEKIITAHLVNKQNKTDDKADDIAVSGRLVEAKVDIVLANDITAPISIREFHKLGIKKVFNKDRVVLVPDHFTPNKDIKSAEQAKLVREFARAQELTNYFEIGRMGIEHVLLPEQGIVVAGDIVVGADSHTCTYGAIGAFATGMGSTDIAVAMATGQTWLRVPETIRIQYHGRCGQWIGGKDLILFTIGKIGVSGARYKAIEFSGSALEQLSMDSRLTMANMAIEAGAKAGLFTPDHLTQAYLEARAKRPYTMYQPDADAHYHQVIDINVDEIEPQVAFPHLPENTKSVSQASDVKIDQAVIGSCTNGRIEDLRIAAKILHQHKVHKDVRCLVIPGSQLVYQQALAEGLLTTFVEAGAAVSTPTCGPCLGGHMGILAQGERSISTTNRNFRGRMGHPESEVYLSGPAVAAASAILGRIASPEEV